MTISDIEGRLLVLESSQYTTAMANGTLVNVNISVSYNGGDITTKNIAVTDPVEWICGSIPISSTSGSIVSQVYIKNIVTGQEFPLLSSNISMVSPAMTNVFLAQILAGLSNLGITGITQSVLINNANTYFRYYISNLPSHIALDRIEYSFGAIDQVAYASLNSLSGNETFDVILADDKIYILPSFFSLDAFVDGVYSVALTIEVASGVTVTEEGCYFLDVNLKCRLIINDDLECGTDKSYLDYLMLHYSLIQASNCNCDCQKMLDIFNYLNRILPLEANTEDCGCN